MDFMSKDPTLDTCESFTSRVPLSDKNSLNIPLCNQIQQCMSTLVTKKAELKQAKLKHANLLQKLQQQDVRISQIKITLDHELHKDTEILPNILKLQADIQTSKQSIQELTKNVKNNKAELANVLEEIIKQKTKKEELQQVCASLRNLISDIKIENQKIQTQVGDLETLIITSQNDTRAKNQELTSLKLQKTEICTLINYLQQQQMMLLKAKNSANSQSSDLTHEVLKYEQKQHHIQKQQSEIDFGCEQIFSQNSQIEELNKKLLNDLDGVRKHLVTVQKMNQLLKGSLLEYGFSGDKVSRMVANVKSFSQ